MNNFWIGAISFIFTMFSAFFQLELSKSVTVSFLDKSVTIDGILKKEEWSSVDSLNGLISPWTTDDRDHTVFKYFHTKDSLYFSFDVVDKQVIISHSEGESAVAKGDRVELFFSSSIGLEQYYCLEMAPNGRVLDYLAHYYRKFDEKWNMPGLRVAAQITSQGYSVEGSIPLTTLEQLKLKGSFYLGIFRGDFIAEGTNDVTWYSFIDPQSKNPDFHIPGAFVKCRVK